MASRTVLLVNGERRKVVEIPTGVADRDYDYLRGVFARTFSAKDEANVHLQRYDRDWEEWIDVDEDFVAVDRERIKVVESLDLHAAKSQDEELLDDESDISGSELNDCLSSYEEKRMHNIAELEALKEQLGLKNSLTTTKKCKEECGPSTGFPLRKGVKQERKAEEPLPQPFPLPQNYPASVEAGLRAQNTSIIPKFLSCIASSMLCYKLYPTRDEYLQVAIQITEKYKWMCARIGPPTGAIVTGLKNRFKEFRRDKKQRKETPIVDATTPPKCQPNLSKSPVPNLMQVPPIPAGEDDHSFERLNNMLKSEYKKQRPRKEVLVELMRATYPQRRANILATSTPVADLLIKYPFLGKEEQLLGEMERISEGGLQWESGWMDKMLLVDPTNSLITDILSKYDPDNNESRCLAALCVLCCLSRDSRSKCAYDKVIQFIPETEESETTPKQPEPILLVSGTMGKPGQCTLYIEEQVVLAVTPKNAAVVLLSSFYVFNLKYPHGLNNFYTVLEAMVLNILPKNPSIVVSRVLSLVNA